MKRFATFSLVAGLATATSSALAAQTEPQVSLQDPKPQPVMMTETQMDNVAAGLITITVVDAVDVEDVVVAIPVQAAVGVAASAAVAVLGTAVSDDAVTRLGNQTQSQRINR